MSPVLGILGGGQLGRMTALAAAPLGVRAHVYDTRPGCAMQVTDRATIAGWDDHDALAAFADAVDAVTLEFENIPASAVAFLEGRVPVRPGSAALRTCQDRIAEKSFLRDAAGLPTTAWWAAYTADEAAAAVAAAGRPCVIKTARQGYDGKGQAVARTPDEARAVWQAIGAGPTLPAVVEAFVDFVAEASVVVARGADGQIAAFELVENRHEHHILSQTIAPAEVADDVRAEAGRIARRAVEVLGYVGVMGVELFLLRDGGVLVNELAPRPHNSGHWTMDACVTGQFEQAVRAAIGLPLGDPSRRCDAVMHNLIGAQIDEVPRWLGVSDAKVHVYGKGEARPGRKMGHVNVLGRAPQRA